MDNLKSRNILTARVDSVTDANNFISTGLIGRFHGGNDTLVGMYVVCFWDAGGAGAAPQGEQPKLITDYNAATGIVTHNAFGTNLAREDIVRILTPDEYEIYMATGGGPDNIQDLMAEAQSIIDIGGGVAESLLMDGTEQTLYERTGRTVVGLSPGITIDWTGLNFGAGEDTTIIVYEKVDGTNYRVKYTETFLAAALPSPVLTPHPRNTTDVVPAHWYTRQDVKITATQAAIGGGWNTLKYYIVDGAPGG